MKHAPIPYRAISLPYPDVPFLPQYPGWDIRYPTAEPSTWSMPIPDPWLTASELEKRAKQRPLTFVLVHGSWADSSFWNGIAAHLRRMGHLVYTPEYPGHGADPNNAVTHAMITKSVADFIVSQNLHDLVLVGHSFGGSVIQTVAQLIPETIRRLVFYDAFVLKDGQMVADEFPPAAREALQKLRESSMDDTIMLPFPLFRETFVNLASLDTARKIYSGISPEPASPFYEKLDLHKFYSLNLPASYLYFTEDHVLPQGGDYGWHPHMSGRLGLFRLIKGQGDHLSTARTDPGQVAAKIYEAGRD
ncbi:alpha/beta fold hydrolase [Paenibacillus nasutitermitis]|uniref:Salicylate esterase n=1 Tax=Paenibacillus nasutitermitis TaxID=1652958 RepID=A0A916YSH0_9BACL|nr:alpha/beta hydrolase [Paenibacillus nasutitermitis]GGD57735.1 salicylate esterase [Paenibacillus nasutitermitis]